MRAEASRGGGGPEEGEDCGGSGRKLGGGGRFVALSKIGMDVVGLRMVCLCMLVNVRIIGTVHCVQV
jgi:hypothetical protein